MVLKYDKLFMMVDPLNHEAVTVLVEYVETKEFQAIAIRSLEGEYESTDEYMRARSQGNPFDISSSLLPLTLSGAQRLVDALSGALQAAQGS